MIITVMNDKGGVAKTTTAIHLAAFLATQDTTVLVDSDAIRSASKWHQRGDGKGLPFDVIGYAQLPAYMMKNKPKYVVIDTEGNLGDASFKEAAAGSQLLIIPAVPETVATDGLITTIKKLKALNHNKFKVLLTMVPARPQARGEQLRADLLEQNIPLFNAQIPRLSAFEKAAEKGIRVCDVKSNKNAQRAWDAYVAAGKEIING